MENFLWFVDEELSGISERSSHPGTRGHGFKLSIPRCKTEIRRRFSSVRCVLLWNCLTDLAVELDNCNKYKRYFDKFMPDIFYET